MFKKVIYFALALSTVVVMSSCSAASGPLMGVIYTDVHAPVTATSNPVSTKVGTAKATSILGLVATGDASINAAAKSAGITKISHVDYEATSILGIFATYTVYVYGN